MTIAAPFTRHAFGGAARSVVELKMQWNEAADRSLVEQVLTALAPALRAGALEIAQVSSGRRNSRKAKLDIAKVGAAIEAAGSHIVSLTGRPGRGFAMLGGVGGGSLADLHVEVGPDAPDMEREAADGEVLATVFDALLATKPDRGFVHLGADREAESALHGTVLGVDEFHAFKDVAWRQIVDPAHADALRPLREAGWVTTRGAHCVIELPGTVSEVLSERARSARAALLRAVHPGVASDYEKALRQRAESLEAVEVDLDADAAELLIEALIGEGAPHAQAVARQWDGRTLPLDELAPADTIDAPLSRDLPRVLEPLGAEALALLHQEALPGIYPPSLSGLRAIDLLASSFGINRIGRLAMFDSDIERHLVPAIGAYLGELMVRDLNGAWAVPPRINLEPDPTARADWPVSRLEPRDCDRIAVVVGNTAWFPFARARRLVHAATRQGFNPQREPIVEMSLTKMMRAATRMANE